MVCPRCGSLMTVDSHRKIPLNMCYECGYIEGRSSDSGNSYGGASGTNYSHMKNLNINEMVAFLSRGIGVGEEVLSQFLEAPYSN